MDKEFLIDIKPDMEIPEYELILCNPNEEPIISIKNKDALEHKPYFANNIDELSFGVPFYRSESNGQVVKNEVYNLLKGDYLVLLNNNKYFIIDEIKETKSKEGKIYKHVHCYSREYELKNKLLSGYKGDSRLIYDYSNSVDENGFEVGFFNYIEKITSWRVGYISPIILLKYRSLELTNSDVLTSFQDIQKAFGCIFQFNTLQKTIGILPDVDGTDYMVMQKMKLDSAIKYLERIINFSINDSSILRSELNVILIALDYLKEEMQGVVEIAKTIGIINSIEYIDFINAIGDVESLIISWNSQTIYPIELSPSDIDNIKNKFTALYDTLPPFYSVIDIYDATQIGNNPKFYISDKNFLQSLSKNINSNNIKTRIYLYGKDDISIQEYNIIGKPYLERYHFYKTTEYMEQDLIDALNDYEAFVETKRGLFNGYLAVLKNKNSELSTLKIELTTLQTDLKIIKTELGIAKATGQPTTELEALEKNKLNEISTKNSQIQVVEDDIESVRASIKKLGQDTDISKHLTDIQLRKLDSFIKEYEFRDSNYTEESLEDLIIEGQRLLYKKSQPAIQFELGVVDFFSLIEGYHVRKKVKLGDTILLYNEELGFDYEVRFIGYTHKPDSKELKLFLSNTNDMNDTNLYYKELFSKFNKTNQDVNQNKDIWNKAQEAYNVVTDVFSDNQITNIEANSLRILCDNMRSEAIEVRDIASKLGLTSRQEYTDCGTAMALLQTEVNKWINKTDYPLPVTTQEREDITNAFQNLEIAIANLYNVIDTERDNRTRDYVDVEIEDVNSQITEINVDLATIGDALIKKASIEQLQVIEAMIKDLNVEELNALKAYIVELQALHLDVAVADIDQLQANYGDIMTLLAGNLTADNFQAGAITATSAVIANGAILNAMIKNLTADKIVSGSINTNLVEIGSESGNFIIADNTLQINDGTTVRVQIGKDASGDYSLSLWDADGNLMFDARGLTEDAIKDEIIRNDMIASDANISADKIDIGSVVRSINDGVTKLESSSILYDGKSLNVAFNELTTNLTTTVDKTVKSTDVEYYLSTSQTELSGGSWQTTAPPWTDGKYMWSRTKVVLTDGTIKYTPSETGTCIAGAKGDKGDDGKGVASTAIAYQLHTSGTSAPTGTWSSDIPAITKGKYLWTRTIITYTDNSTSTSYSTSYYPTDGQKGDTGRGITSITPEYYLSTSKTTQTGGSWTTTPPTWVKGKYIWTRNKIVYNNPTSTEYTTPVVDTSLDNIQADIETRVKTTDFAIEQGKIATLISDVSTIEGEVNSTKSRVSTVEQTVGSISTKVSNLETDNNTTKSNLSALTQDVNSFKTTVSSTYTTKEEFGNLEIGGRNLLKGTKEGIYLTGSDRPLGRTHEILGNGVGKITIIDGSVRLSAYMFSESKLADSNIPNEKNTTFTFSADVRTNSERFYISLNFRMSPGHGNSISSVAGIIPNTNGEWKRVSSTIYIPESTLERNAMLLSFGGRSSTPPAPTGSYLEYRNFKLERGNKATDWTPAPEDQEAFTVETVNTAKSEIKQYADQVGINVTNTVAQTYETKENVNQKINTAKGEIKVATDAIESRVSNVESTMNTVTPHHIILTNENQSILTDSTGKVTIATTVTTDIDTFKGVNRIAGTIGTPILKNSAGANISFGTITKSNPTTSASGKVTWTIPINTNISSDNGWIEIPITIEGKSYTKKLTWNKAKEGAKGDKGDTGSQGIQGPKGADGTTYYTWIKYADTPTSGMSDSPTGKTYMGIAYNKTSATKSTNYADYSWSLIKGTDGVQGPPGKDGQTLYTWIKYADNASGGGMSDSPMGKTYIGVAHNKTTATESNIATDYSWSLIKGDKGDTGTPGTNARLLDIVPSQIYFVKKSTGITPDNIILTPNFQNCTYSKWEYSINGTSWTVITRTTSSTTLPWMNSSTRVLTIPKAWAILNNNNYVALRVKSTTGESDVQTISILYDVTELETRVNNAEQKITPTAIMQTVEQQVSQGGTTIAQKADIVHEVDQVMLKFDYLKIPRKARYIRSYMRTTDGTSSLWSEIKVISGGVNVALNKSVTEIDFGSGARMRTKEIYIDGVDNVTFIFYQQTSEIIPALQVDLGQVYDIDSILDILALGNGGAWLYNYKLQISEDGVNWNIIFDGIVDHKASADEVHAFSFSGFQQGITSINGEGIKVKHSDDWSQYSQVKFDGFVRGYPNGEVNYLKGIDIIEYMANLQELTSAPQDVTVTIPNHYKDRTDFKVIPFPGEYNLRFSVGEQYIYDELSVYLYVTDINTTTSPPTVKVQSYIKVTVYASGARFIHYYPMSFNLILIGN